MKNLYTLLSILILCFIGITGCKTLFDVVPAKDIYSPMVLQKNAYPVYTLGIPSIVVNFSITDPSLSYGALTFYDSASAAAFVLERKIVGQPQAITAAKSLTTNIMSTTVGYDNTRGQYIYVTPFAYKSEKISDSLSVTTLTANNYKKVFSSQGYMRLKISPWTHVTDLPGPAPSPGIYTDKPILFPVNNKLFCIKYDGAIDLGVLGHPRFVYGYEFDPTAQIPQWTQEKKFENKFCQVCMSEAGKPTSIDHIDFINNVYFANGIYHIIGAIKRDIDNFKTGLSFVKYISGEVLIDKNFVPITRDIISPVLSITKTTPPNNYILTDVQDDRVTVVQKLPSELKIGDFVTKGYWDDLKTSKRTFFETKEDIGDNKSEFMPDFSCVINNKLVVNTYKEVNTFKVYNLDDNLKYLNEYSYNPNVLWSRLGRRRLTISLKDNVFVLNDILNIYWFHLNIDNIPVFSIHYSGWFPATSGAAFNQGIALNGKLWFLIKEREIWTFNPNNPMNPFISGDTDVVQIVDLK